MACDRRRFLECLGLVTAAGWAGPTVLAGPPNPASQVLKQSKPGSSERLSPHAVVKARGTDYAAATRQVIDRMGGMSQFVSRGSKVVIKPNVGWDKPFHFRANTHPEIVRAVIEMVLAAGPASVKVLDFPVEGQNAKSAFDVSGIGMVGMKKGVTAQPVFEPAGFRGISIPGAAVLKEALVIKEILDADVIINIPVAKSHFVTDYTGALKNWMGIIRDRGFFHTDPEKPPKSKQEHRQRVARCIVDIQQKIRPTLSILDASVAMLTGGPPGPGEQKTLNLVLASTDPVALDVVGIGLFPNLALQKIETVQYAAAAGLGLADPAKIPVVDCA